MFGVAASGLAAAVGGEPPAWLPLAIAGIMGATAYLLRAVAIEGAGDLARRLYMGADQGTASSYSAAQALEVRGDHEAALAAYRAGAEQYPEDPEPLIQGARILKEDLDRAEEALNWIQEARAIPGLEDRGRIRLDNELVDLYEGPLDRPHLALPLLARMAEEYAGSRVGDYAAQRLSTLRARLFPATGWGNDDPGARTGGDDAEL